MGACSRSLIFQGERAIFNLFKKYDKPRIDRRQSLEGIPVLNDNVSCADDNDGRLMLNVKLGRGPGLLARFRPPVLERNIRLDEIGGFVFKLIDNQRTTQDIINAFLAKYRVNRREAVLSVVAFLKSLVKKGIISIVIR